jgi:5'-deoxynucleotidase YfbR-like HD superfamily hydrolase
MRQDRAWVRLSPSGRQLNLLNPDPKAWDDADLAVGLSRTYRWGGHSAWELPLSVAQHSLTVLAIRRAEPGQPLTEAEQLRELLHDADEGFLSFDCITPVKPHLGEGYNRLVERLQAAIIARYRLPA